MLVEKKREESSQQVLVCSCNMGQKSGFTLGLHVDFIRTFVSLVAGRTTVCFAIKGENS